MTNTPVATPWDPEDDLDAEHITLEIPKSLWDNLIWAALKVAIELSDTKEQVFKLMKAWNNHNTPLILEKELFQKIIWALRKWDTKFHQN